MCLTRYLSEDPGWMQAMIKCIENFRQTEFTLIS